MTTPDDFGKKTDFGFGKPKVIPLPPDIPANGHSVEEQLRRNLENELGEKNKILTLEDFDHLRITEETIIPPIIPIISLSGTVVIRSGSLHFISAAQKALKTSLLNYIMACMLSETVKDKIDGLDILFNNDGKAIIHIDTEQYKGDHKEKMIAELYKRANIEKCPNLFRSYNVLGLDPAKIIEITNNVIRFAAEKFSGLAGVFIDGSADFVESTNLDKESSAVLQNFASIASDYNCPLIAAIHTNPQKMLNGKPTDDPKEHGHMGTKSQRKGAATITLTRNGRTVTLAAKNLRRAEADDIKPIKLIWDKLKNYIVRLDDTYSEIIEAEDEASRDKVRVVTTDMKKIESKKKLLKVMNKLEALKQNQISQRLVDEGFYTDRAGGNKFVKKCVDLCVLEKGADELFRIA